MDIEQLERNYKSGKTPLWIYTQLNGKSAQENYNLIQREIQQRYINEKEIEKQIRQAIETALNEILKPLEKCR